MAIIKKDAYFISSTAINKIHCCIWQDDEKHFYDTYFQRMAARMHCSATIAEQWYNQRYMPLMVKMIGKYQPLSEWVMPFIAECKEKGVKMVVLSDYEYAEEKLRALGLNPELFDWVASAPLLGGLKPAPELMHIITKRMGVAQGSRSICSSFSKSIIHTIRCLSASRYVLPFGCVQCSHTSAISSAIVVISSVCVVTVL